MTLLSDIITTLGLAAVPSYTVYSAPRNQPGGPDLVVSVGDTDAESVAEVLRTARLPLARVAPVEPGEVHLWRTAA